MSSNKSDVKYLWELTASLLSTDTASRFLRPTGRDGELKKCDYVSALTKLNAYRAHGLELTPDLTPQDIWNALTPSERFRLSFYTPCLARPIDDLTPDEQVSIYTDPDWVFTEKHRGIRAVLVINGGETHIYSRNYTDDCKLIDYAPRIAQKALYDGTYATDVIMTITEPLDITDDLNAHGIEAHTRPEQALGLVRLERDACLSVQDTAKQRYGTDLVTFHLIHPLYVSGVNYLKRPLGDGMNPDVYGDAVRIGRTIGLNVAPVRRSNATTEAEKRVFLESVLDSGGDGVVAQNRNGAYDTTDRRPKTSYIKIKRVSTERMSDTIDAFVSGTQDGKLRLSIYEEKDGMTFPRLIAKIKPPKQIDRSQIYVGMVMELSGTGINASGTLVKPKFVKLRDDKERSECVYTSEFLKAQRNVGFHY